MRRRWQAGARTQRRNDATTQSRRCAPPDDFASLRHCVFSSPIRFSSGGPMKPGTRFLLGAAVIVAGTAGLIATGVKETGVYFLTPTELIARTAADPTFHDVGLKVGAKVVPGSVQRDQATRTIAFRVTDGASGVAISFCDSEERSYLNSIQPLIKKAAAVRKDHPTYPARSVAERDR